ncbi:MAG: hypothetical protein ACI9R3_006592 [Verrucomicrobiales bacterium]
MAKFTDEHIHERTDAQVRPLVIFLIVMASSVLISFGIINVLFEFFTQRTATIYGPAIDLSSPGGDSGAPQLQVVPGLDRRAIDAHEAERLESYGWVDERHRVAHVPIETAIDMLLESGVPARAVSDSE